MLSDTVEILTFVINRFQKKKEIMGRVMLGFLAEEGGAAAWFRAALGRVMLGFLGSKVRVDRSVESIHVQNC